MKNGQFCFITDEYYTHFPDIKFIHKNLLLQLQEQQLKNNPQTLPTTSKKHKIEPNR